ncbi:MAG: alpha/beta fold hydrolase [Moraxellaceae bacterium]|nr:alpha/beta fold hydrolase [Moraxellaceae bacterium]
MRELTVIAADGHQFSVRLHEASTPRGVIVLAPAMGVPATYYDRFAVALAEQGIHVAVTDLRGQGSSSLRAGRGCDWGYADMVEQDWPALTNAIADVWPSLPLWFLGHSQGGQLSLLYLAHRPANVAGVLTIACGSTYFRGWNFPQSLKLLVQTQFVRVPAALLGYFPGERLGFGGRQARSEMADWANAGLDGRYDLRGAALDYEAALAQAERPVHLFSLDGDAFAPRGATAVLARKLPPALVQHHHLTDEHLPSAARDHFRWSRHPEAVIPFLLDAAGLRQGAAD